MPAYLGCLLLFFLFCHTPWLALLTDRREMRTTPARVTFFQVTFASRLFWGAKADKQKTKPLKKQTTTWLLVIGFCTKRQVERWQSAPEERLFNIIPIITTALVCDLGLRGCSYNLYYVI